MKSTTFSSFPIPLFHRAAGPMTLVLGLILYGGARAAAAEDEPKTVDTVTAEASADSDSGAPANKKEIVIERIEPDDHNHMLRRKEAAWLGVGTEEVSEALSAQLELAAGQGLVVTYVAADSPAARAGLQKNDVLVKFDGQLLVHPAQLRKLIQMHKSGDDIQFEYFRAGKKQSASATLAKTTANLGALRDERAWQGDLRELQRQLKDLNTRDLQAGMKSLHESLAKAGLDRDKISIEVRRSIEEARRAAETALRQASNELQGVGGNVKVLEDLVRSGVDVDNHSTVIVNRKGSSVQTQVKTDETGSYVVVANPQKRLTVHDQHGKLIFDGEIETPQQQEKVPKEVWAKVEPMLKEMEHQKPDSDNNEN